MYWPSTEDGAPPPTVVFSWQLEVCKCNSHAGRDAEQYDVDDEQNAVQSKLLAAPQRGKYVVQLHRYCTAQH